MENKTWTVCINEKHITNFHKKLSESKDCSIKIGEKRYYENKDKKSKSTKNNLWTE